MAEAMTPTLDLTTDTAERPTVKIDGREYRLRTSNDLTLSQWHTLQEALPKVGILLDIPKLTKHQSATLDGYLEELTEIILLAPAAVKARLGQVTRTQILDFFCGLSAPSLVRTRATLEASVARGATSSPSSRGTTAATRRRGGRGSRSGPSART